MLSAHSEGRYFSSLLLELCLILAKTVDSIAVVSLGDGLQDLMTKLPHAQVAPGSWPPPHPSTTSPALPGYLASQSRVANMLGLSVEPNN